MAYLREDNTLVVWKLDWLGRLLTHLIQTVIHMGEKNIGFKSLQESLDTTTSGKLIFHIFGAIAEFERESIRDRMSAARARGKKGRRRNVLTPQLAMAKSLAADPGRTVTELCEVLKLSPATYYRHRRPSSQTTR
ncbi:MAG: recombinase family protein [Stenomitos frigidus ULC029]